MKEIENVELARRNTQPVPMDMSAMGSQEQKLQGNCSWCGNSRLHGERLSEEKTEYMQNNQTSGWSGTDDKTKGKPSKGKGKQDKGKGKCKPGKGKGNSKNKGKGTQHGKKKKKKSRNGGHEDKQDTQTGQEYTEWTDSIWITLTTGLTQTGGRATGSQICGLIVGASGKTVAINAAGSRTAQFNAWRKHFIQCWGVLTMCELSVNDGNSKSERNEGGRNLCDDGNDKTENWVQKELTDGHKKLEQKNLAQKLGSERAGHKSWKNRILVQKLDSEQADGVITTFGAEIGKTFGCVTS